MNASVQSLAKNYVREFYPIFSHVLKTEFPGYAPEVVDFLLTRIYTPQMLKTWLVQGEKLILVSRNDTNSIVGFALIDMPYGGVSFCRWLGVLPAYQHKGIGTQLITTWEKHAREQKAHKMEVAGQPTAKVFYEKMGLNLEGFRKASYFGIDQYLFGKILGEPNANVMTR